MQKKEQKKKKKLEVAVEAKEVTGAGANAETRSFSTQHPFLLRLLQSPVFFFLVFLLLLLHRLVNYRPMKHFYTSLRLCPSTYKLLATAQHWGRQERNAHVMGAHAHMAGEKATNCTAPSGQRATHSHTAPDASPCAPPPPPMDHIYTMGPPFLLLLSQNLTSSCKKTTL